MTLSSHRESETVTTAVNGDIDLSNAVDLERHLEEHGHDAHAIGDRLFEQLALWIRSI